ncbi:hypothetical protein WMO79_10375 [Micrococcaceae bacterium Sec7.4]
MGFAEAAGWIMSCSAASCGASLERTTAAAPPFAATGGTHVRKIILMMSVSLEGFFETADRDISWHRVDEELLRHLNEQSRTLGALGSGASP